MTNRATISAAKAMNSFFAPNATDAFLRAEPGRLREWLQERRWELAALCALAIVAGAGVFGGVIGSWSGAWQALYNCIKLPLVIFLTTLGNGLLNGMLAPLLGLNVTFRQSLIIVLMSFAIASLMLGALSPVALLFVWNTPPLTSATHLSSPEYQTMQLLLTGFIAFAGIVGNIHLVPLLAEWADSLRVARRVLLAWLAVNLFLGSQISWILRPFVWDATGANRFIGQEYFQGSFYETVFEAARHLIFS